MNITPLVRRHPSLRWLAPLAVVGVGVVAATGVLGAQASSEPLPRTSPAALIAAVKSTAVTGFSGTIVSRMSLGLPEVPSLGGGDGASMTSLLTGSHTLQVWYGGVDQQRVAVLGETEETDLFRSGRQLWQWTSSDRVAVHTTLPARPRTAGPSGRTPSPASPSSLTPSGLAQHLMADLDPTTVVRVVADRRVANRDAYELVLTPRTPTTRIGSVHISVDGRTKVPLGVQVYARGAVSPAVDIAYTSIRFERPAETYFSFMPPSGATVRTVQPPSDPAPGARPTASDHLTESGEGWSTVFTYRAGASTARIDSSAVGRAFQRVSGAWGKGRLLTSDLLTVLVTDDGRVLAGAVDADVLYAAAK